MEFYKIISIILIVAIMSIFLKQTKPEIALLLVLAVGILVMIYVVSEISGIIDYIDVVMNKTNIDNGIFLILIKILGVGYITEFASSICIDSGNTTLSDKVMLVGKVMIMITSFPIVESLFTLILELL